MPSAIIYLALMATTAIQANAAVINLSQLETADSAGTLGTHVFFKLDSENPTVAGGEKYRFEAAEKAAQVLECGSATRLFRHAGKHEAAHEEAGLHMWYQVTCDSALTAMRKFTISGDEATAAVKNIEPELKVQPTVTSNDPELSSQTHYPAINLFEAWDVERGSPDVVVQVLDTGIDMSHEDFQLNIWTNPGEICGNGIDDDNNGYVDDCHGWNHADDRGDDLLGPHWHGSHCGGTIAADTDNGVGVAGVAGGTATAPGAKLMISVGFGDTSTGGFAEALLYGADNGAQISSNSWVYTAPGAVEQAVLDAIDYYNTKQGIVVFAAGNDNSQGQYYPGFYYGTIAVAAVADSGVRASFSNYGSWIDISAPGVNVYSTLTANTYGTASGTSMACPHVAGVLALGLSVDSSRAKPELLGCAYSTARNVDALNPGFEGALGAGYIDAKAFVECVANGAPSPAPTVSRAPTTAAPTLRPTISKAPTPGCGVCDQTLELKLTTDNYPGETTWTVEHPSPSTPACVKTEESGGPYASANTVYEETITTKICAGETYKFSIFDSWGDGICCGYGSGWYELRLNGVEVVAGGEFGSSEVTEFIAPSSSGASPTSHPTAAPTPMPTSHPTAAPTPTPTPSDGVVPAKPTDFKMKYAAKLGPAYLLRWHAGDVTQTSYKFIVEYQIKGSSEWRRDTPPGGAELVPEWSSHFYYILSDAAVPCGTRITSRVAQVSSTGAVSEWATGKQRKLKC